ncbi:MAG: hypothetical protein II707_08465, partial [Spirochaetales bacterium]|nr:hypothetical protein [Spirochaetales bacterium]
AKGIRYDAFFENENVADSLDMSDVLTVDLYGLKSQYDSLYVLTRKDLPYHKLKTFGLNMRPHENNILFDVPGDDIYLYALDKAEETNKKTSAAFVHKTIEYYYNISYGTKRVLQYILYRLRLRVEKFFRRER